MMLRYELRARSSSLAFQQISCSHRFRSPLEFVRQESTRAGAETQNKVTEFNKLTGEAPLDEATPFQLPVYLRDHRWQCRIERFRHGISDFHAERLTARAIAMLKLMDLITDKASWHRKIFNEIIVRKWREEARAMPGGLISEKAFDWCVKELRDKAKEFEEEKYVSILENDSRCVKSDELIPERLRNDLRRAVEPLLTVGDDQKDWHPKSDSQVLNLVHPSMYPLVAGRSRFLKNGRLDREDCLSSMGKGAIVEQEEDIPRHGRGRGYTIGPYNRDQLCSTRFQWLPSDIHFVGEKGTDVKVSSYINNLHPIKHRGLYRVIEEMIGNSIPLWNSALVKEWGGRPGPRIKTNEGVFEPQQPSWMDDIWKHEADLSPLAAKIKEYIAQPDNPLYADKWAKEQRSESLPDDPKDWDIDEVYQALEEVFYRTRTIMHPEPGEYGSPSYEEWRSGYSRQCIENEFRQRGLQVIVKLSSIELTPKKPAYPEGSWHLEGMLNENIVATSIYYYDVDNVTESRIRFSQEAYLDERSLQYEQSDHDPLAITFGTESMTGEPAVQEIGSIATRHGRIIAFPNTLRHKVEPFSLTDRTKPGHRRFLVLWLVDPYHRIVSTADVPPQQLTWAEVTDLDEVTKGRLMTVGEAKEHRLELMWERTSVNFAVENNFDTYNLCEH
ncbi:hypothetical protein SLS60_004846 [Paraconiothyrium brasiliense]|uniref:Fe2OG dioxygenase domain-containing protein n=1 Tax=Paraconiothyrium brasiliense TaxID=300254 RepID=A0ABR3RM02_9PLEO